MFDYLRHFPDGAKSSRFKKQWDGQKITMADFWTEWIGEKTLRINTERGWESAYKLYIKPYFGTWPVIAIKESDILKFRKQLIYSGHLKESTINHRIIKPLCMCLGNAVKKELIENHPCEDVRRLVETPGRHGPVFV